MTTNTRAPRLATLAKGNGWEATVTQVNKVVETSYAGDLVASSPEPNYVDLELTTTWRHPDTAAGWEIGLALRWYAQRARNGRISWRLAELDGKPGRTVGGIAKRLEDGRELELWLGGIKVLERYLVDPADLIVWLDEQAAQEVNNAQGGGTQ